MEDEKMKLWLRFVITLLWFPVVSWVMDKYYAADPNIPIIDYLSLGFFGQTIFLIKRDPVLWVPLMLSILAIAALWFWPIIKDFFTEPPTSVQDKGLLLR